MVSQTPRFYSNPDDSHCMVCCLRMGFEYFHPDKAWTLEELNRLIGKKEGKYTWFSRAYVETAVLGFETVIHDSFDYRAFAREPESYLRRYYDPRHAEDLIAHSDLETAARDAAALAERADHGTIEITRQAADETAIKKLLDQDSLVLAMIDEATLLGMEDRVLPHAILLYGYDGEGFTAHNPGIKSLGSAEEGQSISFDLFEKIRTFGTDGMPGKLMAFGKKV